jgi:hypothetical protein
MALASVSQNVPLVRIRPAEHHRSGVHTYYVSSDSRPGLEYAVQHIRKPGMNRWQCSCPQFFFRSTAKRRHCKHIHSVRRVETIAAQEGHREQ